MGDTSESTKHQASNGLAFGIWSLVLVWNLGFGIWNFRAPRLWAESDASGRGLRPTYEAGGRRDPFSPLVEGGRFTAQSGSRTHGQFDLELYGIVWDPAGNSFALINDAEVRVGDEVGGYRVAEIHKDSVVLRNGGEPLVLTISFEPEPASPGPTGGERR